MSLGSFIKGLFHKIFGSDIWKAFVHAAEGLLKQSLGALAIEAVQYGMTVASDPTSKHDAALQKLLADAKATGYTVTTSMANMLLEIALQKVKGTFDVSSPSVP